MDGIVKRRTFLKQSLFGGIGASIMLGNPSSVESMIRNSEKTFRGIFPIMQTPFRDDDEIDEGVLIREVNYIIEAGGHGITWPQLASEFYVLSDEERLKTAELIVKETRGRLPVIIGVQSTNYWKTSINFAKHAESIGADGIISLPPYTSRASVDATSEYFKTLAKSVSIPIFVQNSGGRYGPAMPVDMIISIAREYPNIAYVKEEAKPVLERIEELVLKGNAVLRGVFSGDGGKNLMNELERGSSGSCPGAGSVDVFSTIFESFRAGEKENAKKIFAILYAMQSFDKIGWLAREKEILRRRGIFKNTRMRVSPYKFTCSKTVEKEFEVLFNNLKPYFKV